RIDGIGESGARSSVPRAAGSRLSMVMVAIVLTASPAIGLALAGALGWRTYAEQQRQIEARIAELIGSNAAGLGQAV
ncbi:MAG: hypothetical protein VW644_14670, partial [Alphaproteobacteria bacterium]